MHFCVRHLKAKKNPAVFIQRQTNNKQAWYTWKSITYTSSLKNQNKWGGWICTKGMNSKETISLIHPKRCVPFTANSSPRIGTVFLFPVFLDYFLPLSCREELGGQLAASKGQPTTKAPLCDRWRLRCSLQIQAWLEFRLLLLPLQGPHIPWSSSFWHSILIWTHFQGGICIRSCIIYNLLKTGNAWTWAISSMSWAENF